MKRINLWMPVAILICSLMMMGLSSCNDVADNPGNRDAQSRDVGYDVDNVKMVESRDVSINLFAQFGLIVYLCNEIITTN